MPKTLFIRVLLYLWLPCYLISLFVLTSTAFLLWLLIPFPCFIASPLLFPLFYVTHPPYSCASNTDLYPLYSCVIVILIPTPVLQFSLRPRFTVFLVPLLQFSSQLSLFPCLTVFPCSPVSQFSLFPPFRPR